MKDVGTCDKPRGAGNRAMSLGFPNGATRSRAIGVIGAGATSEYAVLEASKNSQVRSVVLISGTLSATAKEYLRLDQSVPVLGLAGKEDKSSFREMAEAYALSSNPSSDLLVAVGHGD